MDPDPEPEPEPEPEPDPDPDPIEPQILLLAAAKASVPGTAIPALISRVQMFLGPQLPEYERSHEEIYRGNCRAIFFVPQSHWESIRQDLELNARELDAVRRAHHEQLRRVGRNLDRIDEFETALEIRDAVVIGLDHVE